jgi:hypothetical protein
MTTPLHALYRAFASWPTPQGVCPGMDDGFGARASQADASGENAVDWRKVAVWLAMAVMGVVLWGLAGVALFEAFSHL